MPPVELPAVWPNKVRAIVSLEKSLFDRPSTRPHPDGHRDRKTLLAVTEIYRLIKYGGAGVCSSLWTGPISAEQDRKGVQASARGRQPEFNELYNVQRLTSNTIAPSSKVVISTIQRLYSILKGEPELEPETKSTLRWKTTRRVQGATAVVYGKPSHPSSSTSSSSTSATGRFYSCGGRC